MWNVDTPNMFNFLKSNKSTEKSGIFDRLKAGLSRTRHQLSDGLADLLLGRKTIDEDLLEEIETQLLMADIGVPATQHIIDDITSKLKRQELNEPEKILNILKAELQTLLLPCEKNLVIPESETPFVILVVGINGAGKTTTIGKMAKVFQQQNKRVILAAGDTFRAAATEQLQTWGERNKIPVIAQQPGADSASVLFDAYEAAKARNMDVLIADTAGRLHTQHNLMEELKKIKRVLGKIDASAPHEVMLILDAGTGQNALKQAKEFHEAINLSGVTLTKLDGTAKGGIIFAIAKQFQLPIRYIGVGEKIDDLKEFKANEFIEALFE